MVNRRRFIQAGVLTSLSPLASFGVNGDIVKSSKDSLTEPEKELKIVREADVIVCGGGPAGIAAAIRAARTGAGTVLLEMHGSLGGVWTTGLLSNIIEYPNKQGIMKELVRRLQKYDNQYSAKCYDAELMKLVLDLMCAEAGVEVLLHTRVVAAYPNKKNRLEHIVTESFSGREAWRAKVFIDTTGNGDLAAQAGCKFEMGHPDTGKVQPMSLMALITGLDEAKMVDNGFMGAKGLTTTPSKKKLYTEIKRAGVDASYTMPTMFAIRPGLIAIMANHEYGVSACNTKQITDATINARMELNKIVNGLRQLGGLWSDLRMVATGEQIGIREGRRIHGLYTVSKEDLIKGALFDDAICRVKFSVDVHSLDKQGGGGGYGSHGVKVQPYDIPLRSLIAKDVEGLMMAGRCISGDFFAHASYRVTGNAVVMGEAAGAVAAYSSVNNILPHEVNWKDLLQN